MEKESPWLVLFLVNTVGLVIIVKPEWYRKLQLASLQRQEKTLGKIPGLGWLIKVARRFYEGDSVILVLRIVTAVFLVAFTILFLTTPLKD